MSAPSGLTGTGIEPVEVLYLDRQRLYSYSAQLADGLTTARRLLLGSGSTSTLVLPSTTLMQEDEETTTLQGGVRAGIEVGGKRTSTERDGTVSHSEARSDTEHSNQQSAEDKAEHDNLLLLMERQLNEIGALTDFTGKIDRSGLYRFTGELSFFDWDVLTSILDGWKAITQAFPDVSKTGSGLKADQTKGFSVAMKAAGVTGIQVSMTAATRSITGPLDARWLSFSRDQLRMAYIRDEPIKGTMIAYAAPSSSGVHRAPGLAGHIRFDQLLSTLIGVATRVIPLAVYLPIDLGRTPGNVN